MILAECLSELSKLERHEQNHAVLNSINTILDTTTNHDEHLSYLLARLPDQNRATIRALWRKIEKCLLGRPELEQKNIILNSFRLAETTDEKTAMLNLVFTNGKNLLRENPEAKLPEQIWKWLIESVIENIENIEKIDFIKMAFLVKILNQIMSHNGNDEKMMTQIRNRLKNPLKSILHRNDCQLNAEFMSSGNQS